MSFCPAATTPPMVKTCEAHDLASDRGTDKRCWSLLARGYEFRKRFRQFGLRFLQIGFNLLEARARNTQRLHPGLAAIPFSGLRELGGHLHSAIY